MYVAGQWSATCDRCGFSFLSSELSVEARTKLRVCARCKDPFPKADRPVMAPREATIPWTRPAGVAHETRSLLVQDSAGVVWAVSATDGVLTADTTTSSRPVRRYVLFAASENNAPEWALSVTTEGVPGTDVYDASVHGQGGPVTEWSIGTDTGYLLSIDATGVPVLTAS